MTPTHLNGWIRKETASKYDEVHMANTDLQMFESWLTLAACSYLVALRPKQTSVFLYYNYDLL